ncbi:uncharacterized protein LOC114734595 [Neltuma alba]|uniref:uncharacterized protein LOC114734595 n=1 Tax=Neltuma alba TaxID=207710 RepID=UPI0010A47037|nr:uncharacterized protein LOC114734595 [Prosopis alba]
MSRVSLLKDIHEGTDRWRVIVRGNRIQASVLNRNLLPLYKDAPVEGNTYFFTNFEVSPNVNQYRATENKWKITFTQQTYMREQGGNIPHDAYSFVPLPEIVKCTERNHLEYLIDVVAFVQSIGSLEEYQKDNETKHKLRMVLVDEDEIDVECVLFDECSTNAYTAYLENMENPVVVVINLARVGFTDDAYLTYDSDSLIHFIMQICRSKDKFSPSLTVLSQQIPSQSSQPSASAMMRNNRRMNISDIEHEAREEAFIINCKVIKLETRHGWSYDGCSKCASKPKEENGSLHCSNYKKKPQSVEPKLKVHYVVEDQSGKTSVIFWDKLVVQLFNKNATEIKLTLEQSGMEEIDEGSSTAEMSPPLGHSTPTAPDNSESLTLAEISNQAYGFGVLIKGKRKTVSKKSSVFVDHVNNINDPSSLKDLGRIVKVKQEKK